MSDLDLSAQLSWANAEAYLSLGSGNGKGKGKAKGKYSVRPSYLPLEDSRRRLTDVKAERECRACGREGHWADDRACTMSSTATSSQNATRSGRMTVQGRPSSQTPKSKTCFLLFDDGDDLNAFMTNKEVPLLARQTLLAPRAADILTTVLTMDDDDPWSQEAGHRHGWSKQFTTRTQNTCKVEKGARTHARNSPHKQYRIDTTTPTVGKTARKRLRKDLVWTAAKKYLVKGRQLVASGRRARYVVPCVMKRDVINNKIPKNCLHQQTDCIDCGTYIDPIPCDIYDELVKTRPSSSAFSARAEALTNRMLMNTTVTKCQLTAAAAV